MSGAGSVLSPQDASIGAATAQSSGGEGAEAGAESPGEL